VLMTTTLFHLNRGWRCDYASQGGPTARGVFCRNFGSGIYDGGDFIQC
jgi:hypothetical protein